MTSDKEIMASLIAYLERASKHATYDITVQKLLSRSESVKLDALGRNIFEMERHHPVGGCQYSSGLPMSALITQRYRYTFNPATSELSQERIGEPIIDESEWNWELLAEDNLPDTFFEFEEIKPGAFQLTESCSNFSATVQSAEEGVAQFTQEINGWDFSLSFQDDGISPETAAFLCLRLQDECFKLASEKIREAWNDRIPLEP